MAHCECGEGFDAEIGANFCQACGARLPLTEDEAMARMAEVDVAFVYLQHQVTAVGGTQLVHNDDADAWTRIDQSGFCVIAWIRPGRPGGGVHAITVYALRGGGLWVSSTADTDGRTHTIDDVTELYGLAGLLID